MEDFYVLFRKLVLGAVILTIFPQFAGAQTYEDYVAENLPEQDGVRHEFSRDGSRMLTKAKSDTLLALWNFEARLDTYVKNSIIDFSKWKSLTAYLSQDGEYLAILSGQIDHTKGWIDPQSKTDVVRIDDGKIVRSFPLLMADISFSADSSVIAGNVLRFNVFSKELLMEYKIYSVATGKKVGPSEKISMAGYSLPSAFDPANRYLALSFLPTGSGGDWMVYLFETKDYAVVRQWPNGELQAISHDGNHLAIRERGATRIFRIGTHAGQWNEVGELPFSTDRVAFGPGNTVLDESRMEYDLEGTAIRFDRLGGGDRRTYLQTAESWITFREGKIVRAESVSREAVAAANLVSEGKKLLRAGFRDLGLKKIKAGIQKYPSLLELDHAWFLEKLPELGASLTEQGELLAYYNQQKVQFTTCYAYGVLAASAGHPGLAAEAAQVIRQLGTKLEPADNDIAMQFALILEALAIAVKESPDRAYHYLVERNLKFDKATLRYMGILQHYQANKYFFPLYQDRKKLSYVLGVKEMDLPRPALRPAPYQQPYPDLSGRIIEPGSPAAPVQITPTTPARKSSSPKGRVLD